MSKQNDKTPKIQTSGYNGSEPMRVCPRCGEEKPISEFGFRDMGEKQGHEIRNQSCCKDCR